jgi:YfiH family protein
MISNESSVCLFLFAADCVPILFYDPVQHAIGAAHSGWGGTVKKIACETIFAMQHHFNSRPQDILVGIGPSISVKNYEVGDNVTQAVLKAFGTTDNLMIRNAQTGKMHFDLWQTNKQMLMEIGVKNENIEISGLCTFGNPELFFSARKDEPTGRFGAGIMING